LKSKADDPARVRQGQVTRKKAIAERLIRNLLKTVDFHGAPEYRARRQLGSTLVGLLPSLHSKKVGPLLTQFFFNRLARILHWRKDREQRKKIRTETLADGRMVRPTAIDEHRDPSAGV
jgi:hypothetical protein